MGTAAEASAVRHKGGAGHEAILSVGNPASTIVLFINGESLLAISPR
jgi:hypothetical protein